MNSWLHEDGSSVYTNLVITNSLSFCRQVAEGTVFMKHPVRTKIKNNKTKKFISMEGKCFS